MGLQPWHRCLHATFPNVNESRTMQLGSIAARSWCLASPCAPAHRRNIPCVRPRNLALAMNVNRWDLRACSCHHSGQHPEPPRGHLCTGSILLQCAKSSSGRLPTRRYGLRFGSARPCGCQSTWCRHCAASMASSEACISSMRGELHHRRSHSNDIMCLHRPSGQRGDGARWPPVPRSYPPSRWPR